MHTLNRMDGEVGVRLTAVVPLHNVAGYVAEFLQSISAQRPGGYELDFVFVDDASTDGTVAIIERWIDETRFSADLLRLPHGGVSVARNTGLERARGDWVTFPDPDDILGPDYFASVAGFIAKNLTHHPDLIATNVQRIVDPDPKLRDVHALRFRFVAGTRVVTLDDEPDIFQMSVASAVFPREALLACGARFMTGLHASEDALFVARYLLSCDRARIGLVAEAVYGYRRRATRDSAVDKYSTDSRSYIERFQSGYIPLLAEAAAGGHVPEWLQSMVLYECQWLLPTQLDPARYAAGLTDAQQAATRDALGACLTHVSEDRLLTYDATALPLEARLVALALSGRPVWEWVGFYAHGAPRADGRAVARGYGLTPPRTIATWRGEARVRADAVKSRPLDYFGQTALLEHSVRVPGGVDTVEVDGIAHAVVHARIGESTAQAADRHRREVIGDTSTIVPPADGAVRVWKSIAAAPGASRSRSTREATRVFFARNRRRAATAASVALRGVVRPRDGWLIEHDPDQPDPSSRALYEQLIMQAEPRVAIVAVPGSGSQSPPGSLRWGSMAHRAAAAAARYQVIARRRPSWSGEAHRVAIHRGPVDRHARLRLDTLSADLVIVEDAAAKAVLVKESRYYDDEIIVISREQLLISAPDAIVEWVESRRPG